MPLSPGSLSSHGLQQRIESWFGTSFAVGAGEGEGWRGEGGICEVLREIMGGFFI